MVRTGRARWSARSLPGGMRPPPDRKILRSFIDLELKKYSDNMNACSDISSLWSLLFVSIDAAGLQTRPSLSSKSSARLFESRALPLQLNSVESSQG